MIHVTNDLEQFRLKNAKGLGPAKEVVMANPADAVRFLKPLSDKPIADRPGKVGPMTTLDVELAKRAAEKSAVKAKTEKIKAERKAGGKKK